MKNQTPAILKHINSQNKGYKVKLRYRKNPSNLFRMYLDYWDGNKRHTENLKLYVSGKSSETVSDKETVRLAIAVRNKMTSINHRNGYCLTLVLHLSFNGECLF